MTAPRDVWEAIGTVSAILLAIWRADKRMDDLRIALKEEMTQLRVDLKGEMSEIKGEVKEVRRDLYNFNHELGKHDGRLDALERGTGK